MFAVLWLQHMRVGLKMPMVCMANLSASNCKTKIYMISGEMNACPVICMVNVLGKLKGLVNLCQSLRECLLSFNMLVRPFIFFDHDVRPFLKLEVTLFCHVSVMQLVCSLMLCSRRCCDIGLTCLVRILV